MDNEYVYMTILTNDRYVLGVKSLVKSLKHVKFSHDLVILLPEDQADALNAQLKKYKILGKHVYTVTQPKLIVEPPEGIRLKEHYWNETFFKLQAARCTMFKKIILIDSDMIVMRNIDHLFQYPSYTATVAGKSHYPDWENLNSGLMVLEPDDGLYHKLLCSIQPAIRKRYDVGYDVGDQDVFYEAYPDWKEKKELCLPETYNVFWFCIDQVTKEYHCSYKDFYIVHFIGKYKPWHRRYKDRLKIVLAFFLQKQYWKSKVFSYYL